MWCSGSLGTLAGKVMFGCSNEGEARAGNITDLGKVL